MWKRTQFAACFAVVAISAGCGAPAKGGSGADEPSSFESAQGMEEPGRPPPVPERRVPREEEPMSFSKRMSVKLLRVSTAVETPSNEAINPTNAFRTGVKGIYASFEVKGFNPGATIRVLWYKGEDNLIEEHDLEGEGDKRYAAQLKAPKGLTGGDYSVEVEVEGEMYAQRRFFVGNASGGPAVERAALGTALDRNNMPKKEKTTFKSAVRTIKCGVSFLDLPANARITVNWVSLVEDEEQLHTSDTTITSGGTGTTAAVWNPGGNLPAGPYKVEILVNDAKMAELPFTVE